MPTFQKIGTIAASAAVVLTALAGCSKSDPVSTPPTTAASVSSGGGSTPGAADTSSTTIAGPTDSETHKGDTPVVPSGATASNGEAPAARTVKIAKDGSTVSFNPTTLTIKAGENVTFTGGTGSGTYSVIVPGLAGMTVSGGLHETFTFPNPGTFTITEEISDSTMTITVT